MNKFSKKNPLKQLAPKVRVTTKLVIAKDGTKERLHIAEGPNTHSLAIYKDKQGKCFVTSAQDSSVKVPATVDEIMVLAANIKAGNFNEVLDLK